MENITENYGFRKKSFITFTSDYFKKCRVNDRLDHDMEDRFQERFGNQDFTKEEFFDMLDKAVAKVEEEVGALRSKAIKDIVFALVVLTKSKYSFVFKIIFDHDYYGDVLELTTFLDTDKPRQKYPNTLLIRTAESVEDLLTPFEIVELKVDF